MRLSHRKKYNPAITLAHHAVIELICAKQRWTVGNSKGAKVWELWYIEFTVF
jgi:hypothetical protein